MSLAVVHSRASAGVRALPVDVEVHLSKGLPGFSIVGLPEMAVKESRDRVRSAIINSNFEFPARRIIVNLAPADLPKEGGRFDLAIALGVLAASKQIPLTSLADYEFAGELALSGDLRSFKGALPLAIAANKVTRQLILPQQNAHEAALKKGGRIFPARHLREVCGHLQGAQPLTLQPINKAVLTPLKYPDLKDIKGQKLGRRALEIAAAGGHSLLLIGPPGTGKTMLASRLCGIMPILSEEEALQVAAVYSISQGGFDHQHWCQRPFRSPHHTASSVALVGGGRPPKPGEISLAHRGVLFLDELPEYNRHVLEALREPIEAGKVTISRASHQVEFPAKFQLVAAMNPCPCGYQTDPSGRCTCTFEQVKRYQMRLSGPLLDRIDLHVEMQALPKSVLVGRSHEQVESSEVVRQRVVAARDRQQARSGKINADLLGEELDLFCKLKESDYVFIEEAINRLGLSARAYHRILKVARTIADLQGVDAITRLHLQEALSFRKLRLK